MSRDCPDCGSEMAVWDLGCHGTCPTCRVVWELWHDEPQKSEEFGVVVGSPYKVEELTVNRPPPPQWVGSAASIQRLRGDVT